MTDCERLAQQYAELRAIILSSVPEADHHRWTHEMVLTLAQCHLQDSQAMDEKEDGGAR